MLEEFDFKKLKDQFKLIKQLKNHDFTNFKVDEDGEAGDSSVFQRSAKISKGDQQSGFAKIMQNLEFDHQMNNKYITNDDNFKDGDESGLVKRTTLNEFYQQLDHGLTPWARKKKVCEYMIVVLIYLGYSVTLGIITERLFVHRDGSPPDATLYTVVQVYTILLSILFIAKLVYYLINMYVWCNPKLDPHETLAIGKFRMLVTLGLYQFLMFVIGFTLYFLIDDTYVFIGNQITIGYDPSFIMFMEVFRWVSFVHGILFTLYFLLYLVFIIIVFYFFKKFNGFNEYLHDLDEFEDDESDVEVDALKLSLKQADEMAKGVVRSERAISKEGVQKVIHNFMQEEKPYMFKLISKINKYEGFITYKAIDDVAQEVDRLRKAANQLHHDDSSSEQSESNEESLVEMPKNENILRDPVSLINIDRNETQRVVESNISMVIKTLISCSDSEKNVPKQGKKIEDEKDSMMFEDSFIIMVQELYAQNRHWSLKLYKE